MVLLFIFFEKNIDAINIESVTKMMIIYFKLSNIGVPVIEFEMVYKNESSIPFPVKSLAIYQTVDKEIMKNRDAIFIIKNLFDNNKEVIRIKAHEEKIINTSQRNELL